MLTFWLTRFIDWLGYFSCNGNFSNRNRNKILWVQISHTFLFNVDCLYTASDDFDNDDDAFVEQDDDAGDAFVEEDDDAGDAFVEEDDDAGDAFVEEEDDAGDAFVEEDDDADDDDDQFETLNLKNEGIFMMFLLPYVTRCFLAFKYTHDFNSSINWSVIISYHNYICQTR